MKQTLFYHGTDQHGLRETIKQGYLLHKRATKDFPNMSPCTYLAVDINEARQYGNIIMEVKYDPSLNPLKNNYCKGCWQMRVYEPIYRWRIIKPCPTCGEYPTNKDGRFKDKIYCNRNCMTKK